MQTSCSPLPFAIACLLAVEQLLSERSALQLQHKLAADKPAVGWHPLWPTTLHDSSLSALNSLCLTQWQSPIYSAIIPAAVCMVLPTDLTFVPS